MNISGTARFISDLHLTSERPDLTARFATFLANTASEKISSLFILGDLFDAWIGDDDLAQPLHAEVCELLRRLHEQGTQVFFIAGNRDFLIGDAFARASGMQRLSDIEKVGAGDTPQNLAPVSEKPLRETAVIIMHGDTLCTDDTDYQSFRQLVRNPAWQADFLAQPLTERRAQAVALRQKSKVATREKSQDIMDVNADTVQKLFAASTCRRLIHGHTHRPGYEKIMLADGAAERWVLSDWDTHRGDALEMDAAGNIRRIDLSR